MARKKIDKPKEDKEKVKKKAKKKKVGRPKLLKTKLKERFKTKEDIKKFGAEFAEEWPSIWCGNYDQFINMLACLHRKYVFKYHSSCSRCTQGVEELKKFLGDRVEEI